MKNQHTTDEFPERSEADFGEMPLVPAALRTKNPSAVTRAVEDVVRKYGEHDPTVTAGLTP